MPDGLARLQELGVHLDPEEHHPFRGIRYLDGDTVAEGRFPKLPGAGIRRVRLHEALVRAAEEAGIDVRWGTKVEGLEWEYPGHAAGLRTGDAFLPARWIVGADGLHSRLRRWASLEAPFRGARRFGVRRHFEIAPWADLVEVYWAEGCEAYVTPVAPREVGVAILWSDRKARFDDLIESFPRLEERLRGAPVLSRDRGAGPLRQRVRKAMRGNVALVGDAAGYVDAITGEGLSIAFHQADALAKALRRGDLAPYAREVRRIAAIPEALTHFLLWVERHPTIRRRVIAALARDPSVFSRLLAVHTRDLPIRQVGWATAPRLLWGMVMAR
jgi:flavin-dependent dehydrogenase